ALWIALSEPVRPPIAVGTRTIETLNEAKSTISAFLQEKRRLPYDMGEALAYAKAENKPFYRYDGLGEPLSYTRLTSKFFLLRSFGRDERQTRFHGPPDFAAINFRPGDSTTLSYRYSSIPAMDMYPAALLAGAEAPGRKWRAEVFLDTDTGQRTLFVFGRATP